MRILVDEFPDMDEDCLFFQGNDGRCPFSAGGGCELVWDKHDELYGTCPYLKEVEGTNV